MKECRADVSSSGKVGIVCGQHLVLAVLSFMKASPVPSTYIKLWLDWQAVKKETQSTVYSFKFHSELMTLHT